MNKILIRVSILSLLLTLVKISKAQDYNTTIGIRISPSVGYLWSAEKFDFDEKSTVKRLSANIQVKQNIYKQKLYVESGIGIAQRGYNITVSYSDTLGNKFIQEGKELINHLAIPISLEYRYKHFYIGSGILFEKPVSRKYFYNQKLISTELIKTQKTWINGGQVFIGYERLMSKKIIGSVDAFYSTVSGDFSIGGLANFGLSLNINYMLSE